MINRAPIVDHNFIAYCKQAASAGAGGPRRALDEPVCDDHPLRGRDLLEMFESQLASRHLDLIARELRAQDRAYYTIGGAGHEGNVVLGRILRHTDMAFLHYRSGALMVERARQVPGVDPIRDTLLSQMASSLDPIAGGRHKVWGSRPLNVPPQTSTIASHLPKSVGAAIALGRASKFVVGADRPRDSIVLCTFGDASVNHSVSQGAFNAAGWAAHQSIPVPLLFVCEDNGIGISVRTPPGWVEASFRHRPGIRYFTGSGLDLVEAYRVTEESAAYVRRARQPAFLHLRVVRLLGHAGTDVEVQYRPLPEVEEGERHDPLLATARLLIEAGYLSAEEVLELYERTRAEVKAKADALADAPKLTSPEEVIRPLAPYHAEAVRAEAARAPERAARVRAFGGEENLPERTGPRHLAVQINRALTDLMAKYPETLLFGEDVAAKGGVYYVTADLAKRFGAGRVFNTLLDETTILGLAIGAGHMGLLPLPEIQYLAYVHNAIDQLRGEACSLQFFSNGQYRNPMVLRVASLGYQKGFGGHFHNDNSIAALRDIPGLIVAAPSRGDDAVRMLRTLLALAKVNGRVAMFLEPIALYMTRDLHEEKDGLWQTEYPPLDETIAPGEGRVYEPEARDLTIITYANGLWMSLRAARVLRERHRVAARVVDLRWLCPLNEELIAEQAEATGRVLVVDEGRRSGGVSEAILAVLMERLGGKVAARRITGWDTYIPLGPAAREVLPKESDIIEGAVEMCGAALGRARKDGKQTTAKKKGSKSKQNGSPAKGKSQKKRAASRAK